MSLISIPGQSFTQEVINFTWIVTSVPVDPKCIVHHRFPRVDDVVNYNTNDCVRIGDGATTTFTLDANGVPTVVGVDGTLGVKYGVYECTVTFNGTSEVIPVSHLEDAAIEATFTARTRDAEGFTVFTPSAGSRLLYVDPNEPNDTTAGPDADSLNWYTLSTLPTPDDWENPGAVNAYKTIAGAAAARRDGQPDWILLKRGEVFVPTASLDYNGISGTSAAEPQMVIAYGTGARPWINPAATFSVNSPMINIFAEAHVGVSGIRVYPTFRDPDHGDFAGFANIDFSSGIQVYTGGAPVSTMKGYIFEDNEILFCNGGIGLSGQGGVLDTVIRRNIIGTCYNNDNTSGFSQGDGSSSTDWNVILEENVLDHNGWYQERIEVTGTATSGSLTTCVEVGAFAGVDYATVLLTDDTSNGTGTISSHTDDTLTFAATSYATGTSTGGSTTTMQDTGLNITVNALAGSVGYTIIDESTGGRGSITSNTSDTITFTTDSGSLDFNGTVAYTIEQEINFTGGGAYTIGGGQGAGQANIFNHNMYLRNFNGSIVRNNIISNGSSISIKITSTKAGAENHEIRDFIESTNLCIYNELGLGGGGNTVDSATTRFQDMRVMDNVHVNCGQTQPTGRTLGWGYTMSDWNRGITGNNIIKDSGGGAVTNVFGIQVDSLSTNSLMAYNKVVDIGPTTGATTGDQGCLLISDTSINSNITGLQILKNDFQQQNTDGLVVADWISAETSSITITGNRYHASRGDTDSYRIDAVQGTYAAYATETGETGQTNAKIEYQDIGASIPNYQTSRGGTATIPAFITDALAQQKGSWDTTLGADEVVAYFKDALTDKPDIKFEIQQFALISATEGTTQTISLSAGFGIPKGIILIRSGTWKGYPSFEENSNLSIGFADGTNMICINPQIDSEITPDVKTRNLMRSDKIAVRSQSGVANQTDFIKEGYEMNAFDTEDEFTITLSNLFAPGRSYETIAIVIGGADVDSVVVGNTSLGNTTGAVDHTGIGIEPDLLFGISAAVDALNQSPGGAVEPVFASYGCYINDGNDSQCATSWDSDIDISTPAPGSAIINNNKFLAKIDNGSLIYDVTVSDLDSSGFSTTTSAAAGNNLFGYMAVKFKKRPKMKLVNTTLASAGNFSTSAPGMRGGFGFWSNVMGPSAYNTATGTSVSMGITVFDETNAHTASNSFEGSGETPDDTGAQSAIGAGLYLVDHGAVTVNAASTAHSITNSGVDFTTTANPPATNTLGWLLELGVN